LVAVVGSDCSALATPAHQPSGCAKRLTLLAEAKCYAGDAQRYGCCEHRTLGGETVNVLLVDDHALFREGLALLIRPLMQAGEVLEAGSCEQAKDVLSHHPDVGLVLMDLGLPGASGIEGIAWLREMLPGTPAVALSSADDRDTVLRALDAGAMGFIPKSSSSSVMLGALQLVLAGGIYLPPTVFLTMPRPEIPKTSASGSSDAPEGFRTPVALRNAFTTEHGISPEDIGLTLRQAQVLDRLLQGESAKQIARGLDLAPGTVKSHTSAVLRALNVTTRAQAVVAASRLGWRVRR
jgi:DNA-binding NarL/FixJ family response regulator